MKLPNAIERELQIIEADYADRGGQQAGVPRLRGLRSEIERMTWTLDNVYTVARRWQRKAERDGHRETVDGWGHVIRLCEAVGCQSRGVLRDNGGSIGVGA